MLQIDKEVFCTREFCATVEMLDKILLPHLFLRTEQGEKSVTYRLDSAMNSTRQSALLAASELRFEQYAENRLRMTAKLNNLKPLLLFVLFFPILLLLILCGVFFFTFPSGDVVVMIVLIQLPVWLVVSPLMAWLVWRKSKNTFSRLLETLAQSL